MYTKLKQILEGLSTGGDPYLTGHRVGVFIDNPKFFKNRPKDYRKKRSTRKVLFRIEDRIIKRHKSNKEYQQGKKDAYLDRFRSKFLNREPTD